MPHDPAADRQFRVNITRQPTGYALCPYCFRAVPVRLGERYCVNDGARLLGACGHCGRSIASPYARYCAGCGHAYGPDTTSRLCANPKGAP